MGTPAAPSYANIFMRASEHNILQQTNHILTNTWIRFTGDIQFIWTSTSRNLTQFQNKMNTNHPTIKCTFDSSAESVQFLDVQITQRSNRLETQLYSKPTDSHAYLLPTSSVSSKTHVYVHTIQSGT
ncbi:hypothetical protein HOLleu_02040 [Holothuria leucospilota]|uniref:Uncharacterized protein n=1 Tax=Holothuria leucospilota TaxID=206669 RepID=A0A9Q1CP42_HOLLE|nr:hypothetical protein HOLleu_02040 [Holothuria leucospilota]